MAQAVALKCSELGATITMSDITPLLSRRQPVEFSCYDAVIFGFPVHSLRAPRLVREWLSNIDGEGKRCALFFTYGGFSVHPAHHSTQQLLEQQNFRVVASAQFPGAHTFNLGGWNAFVNRPDKDDLDVACRYGAKIYNRLKGEDSHLLPTFDKGEYREKRLDQFESFRFNVVTQLPTRSGANCCLCRMCEQVCPTGVIDANSGEVIKQGCLACLACVAVCPDHVLQINDTTGSWEKKLQMGDITSFELNNQRAVLYV